MAYGLVGFEKNVPGHPGGRYIQRAFHQGHLGRVLFDGDGEYRALHDGYEVGSFNGQRLCLARLDVVQDVAGGLLDLVDNRTLGARIGHGDGRVGSHVQLRAELQQIDTSIRSGVDLYGQS